MNRISQGFGACQSKKIRSCFFEVDESKTDNCVPESVAAQHIEAPISANYTYPNNQSGCCFQD
jgi:hypothetical protein